LATFIHDQAEKFEDAGRIINWVGGLLTKYAGAWHVQWERKALAGKHPRSWTTYQNNIKLQFEDKKAKDVADSKMEKSEIRVTSEICSQGSRLLTIEHNSPERL
jgi:hypothetical protein